MGAVPGRSQQRRLADAGLALQQEGQGVSGDHVVEPESEVLELCLSADQRRRAGLGDVVVPGHSTGGVAAAFDTAPILSHAPDDWGFA